LSVLIHEAKTHVFCWVVLCCLCFSSDSMPDSIRLRSFTSPKDKICNSTVIGMKSIEIENENVERHLSTNEKQTEKTLNTESKGKVTIEGEYGKLKFERRLSHPREIVWKAITDQKEIFRWLPDYKVTFEGYNGGAIDLVNTLSGSHVTEDVLVCDLYRVFEHEWHVSLIQLSLMENLILLSDGSSSRMAIQIHSLL
jgi:hypothetical protein